MKKMMFAGAAAVALAIGMASPAAAAPPECNWGEATSEFIAANSGKAQGMHAADPSGDGPGYEGRVGLPNLDPSAQGQGKLVATCLIVTGG
jgi:hypothetical protein